MLHESRISDAPPAWEAVPPATVAASETDLERLLREEREWRDGVSREKQAEDGATLADPTAPALLMTHAQRLYLAVLRRLPVPLPRLARRAAKIDRTTLWHWRRDPAFVAAEQETGRDAAELLLASAAAWAVDGREVPVYQQGKLVGYERVYSEKIMVELLRAYRPEQFRPKQANTTTNNVVLGSSAQIAEVVRRLSPTSGGEQPKPLAPVPQTSATA